MYIIAVEWTDGRGKTHLKFLTKEGAVTAFTSEARMWRKKAGALRECLRRGWIEGKVDAILGTVTVIQLADDESDRPKARTLIEVFSEENA